MTTVNVGDFFATNGFRVEHRDIDANLLDIATAGPSGDSSPIGLCCDTSGHLFVLNGDGPFPYWDIIEFDETFTLVGGRSGTLLDAVSSDPFYDLYTGDIAVLPNGHFLIITYKYTGAGPQTLSLLELDHDGNLLTEWPVLDFGNGNNNTTGTHYGGRGLKIALDCDGDTIYYTDHGIFIFRFSLSSGMNLSTFGTLDPLETYYRYGACVSPAHDHLIRTLTPEFMPNTTKGPVLGVALCSNTALWSDELDHDAYQRYNAIGGAVGVEGSNADGINQEPIAMCSYFNPCEAVGGLQIFYHILGG